MLLRSLNNSNLASCCQFYLMMIIEMHFILRFKIFATFRHFSMMVILVNSVAYSQNILTHRFFFSVLATLKNTLVN